MTPLIRTTGRDSWTPRHRPQSDADRNWRDGPLARFGERSAVREALWLALVLCVGVPLAVMAGVIVGGGL